MFWNCYLQKNAVATSHCSQPNTVEYEMGVQWRLLQDRHSEAWIIADQVGWYWWRNSWKISLGHLTLWIRRSQMSDVGTGGTLLIYGRFQTLHLFMCTIALAGSQKVFRWSCSQDERAEETGVKDLSLFRTGVDVTGTYDRASPPSKQVPPPSAFAVLSGCHTSSD